MRYLLKNNSTKITELEAYHADSTNKGEEIMSFSVVTDSLPSNCHYSKKNISTELITLIRLKMILINTSVSRKSGKYFFKVCEMILVRVY